MIILVRIMHSSYMNKKQKEIICECQQNDILFKIEMSRHWVVSCVTALQCSISHIIMIKEWKIIKLNF
jgi:hypothetical protein